MSETGHVTPVTGGGRGIGAATAELPGGRGHAVCVDYVPDGGTAEEVVERMRRAGGRAISVQADVAVRPGVIETEITRLRWRPREDGPACARVPMRRSGTALEVAEAIAWLLSGAASYCTGAIIDVSGGR